MPEVQNASPRHPTQYANPDQQAELLSQLLAEYSEKLRQVYEDVEKRKQRFFVSQIVIVAAFFAVWIYSQTSNASYVATASLGAVVAVAWFSTFFAELKKFRLSHMGFQIAANHLETLVRSASQYKEHAALNTAQHLAIDLRLAEAEVLLKYITGTASWK
jgi:hypothetical protein